MYFPDDRLSNFLVELGRFQGFSFCRNFSGVAEPQTTLNCTQSIWGRSLRISKTGTNLTLCEVEVYGDEDNITGVPGDHQLLHKSNYEAREFPSRGQIKTGTMSLTGNCEA